MTSTIPTRWRRLGAVRPADLATARVELHHAAQLPAALGIARATPQPDFGHHALVLDPERDTLMSPLVPGKRAHRAALRFLGTRLALLDANHSTVAELPLAGRTFAEALAWLERAIERYAGTGGPTTAAPLRPPEHELPAHPVASGGRFAGAAPEPAAELARWFADAEAALAPLARELGAGPLRVWSHHFDLDTVVRSGARTLGLGFSPGDEGIAEPYLYALPDPAPDAPPALDAPIEWTSDAWTGAVLRGSSIAALGASEQAALVERFYRSAASALL